MFQKTKQNVYAIYIKNLVWDTKRNETLKKIGFSSSYFFFKMEIKINIIKKRQVIFLNFYFGSTLAALGG